MFDAAVAKSSSVPSLAINIVKFFGQLTHQAFQDIALNSHFFKEMAEKGILELLLSCLFSEDKSAKILNLKIQILNLISLFFHPIFGSYRPFPWVSKTGQSPLEIHSNDKIAFIGQFNTFCYQLLQRNTNWISNLIDIFEKSGKDTLAQLSVLRVNYINSDILSILQRWKRQCTPDTSKLQVSGYNEAD